ncbi:MAG: UDP-N-acetylmuramate dehydrogenase [Clostridiales bacterium]|nr:UDP-N-acetylmuramate dehydrogenase [Clostridiales bacterium]
MGEIKKYAEETGCEINENVTLSDYTSFKIGGPAELMATPRDIKELTELILKCREYGVRPFILGNGTNLLISDEGLSGLTIFTGYLDKTEFESETDIACMAGVSVVKLCRAAVERSLSGLEFAYGIPGSVGGAVYMNAGAYGGEFKDVLTGCEYLTPDGEIRRIGKEEMDLSYRHSIFSDSDNIILRAFISLKKDDKEAIRQRMDDIISRRRSKQPLQYPSAGSAFKRPEGYFAGGLIEQCGLKGKTIGGAQISEKHAGFIINVGGATARDVLDLIEFTRQTVFSRTGVMLEPEIKLIK